MVDSGDDWLPLRDVANPYHAVELEAFRLASVEANDRVAANALAAGARARLGDGSDWSLTVASSHAAIRSGEALPYSAEDLERLAGRLREESLNLGLICRRLGLFLFDLVRCDVAAVEELAQASRLAGGSFLSFGERLRLAQGADHGCTPRFTLKLEDGRVYLDAHELATLAIDLPLPVAGPCATRGV